MKIRLLVIGLALSIQPVLLLAEKPLESEPAAIGTVKVERAWVQTGQENAIMLSGYATLKSNANNRWLLRGLTARYFRTAMIHRTVMQGGEPRMVLQNSLNIRPGETVQMNKQGYHLMFVGPTRKFKAGDVIKVVLQFENQTPINVNFSVLKRAPK